jgi:DNA-binding IclR family transcriptional regulator
MPDRERRTKGPGEGQEKPADVNVIARALDILELFEGRAGPLSMMAVVHHTGLHKATVFRLLATLVHDGILNQTPSGEYELGTFAAARATTVLQADPLWIAARPVMEELRAQLNETIVLTRRDGDDGIDIDMVSAPTPVMQTPAIGRRLRLHLSPGGRICLFRETVAFRAAYAARARSAGVTSSEFAQSLQAGEAAIGDVIRDRAGLSAGVLWLAIAPGRTLNDTLYRNSVSAACRALSGAALT